MVEFDSIKEQVRAATDIAEIVGGYVKLKRRGKSLVGLCPFHNERTPSFYVTPDMGMYKCFGCGQRGDVFGFVMAMESKTFPEAMRSLAERAQIPMPERGKSGTRAKQYARNRAALELAATFFRTQLQKAPPGGPLQQELRKHHVTDALVREFGIGYAPDDVDGLVGAAQAGQVSLKALKEAALIVSYDGDEEYRDRWRGKLVLPMHSKDGRLVGFAAGTLAGPEHELAFHHRLHSPRRVLFGHVQARAAMRAATEVFLVRDMADVLAMHKAGITNVVACLGTSLTPDHLQMLKPFAQRLVLVHDAQPAAVGSAIRMVHTALRGSMSVYAVTLPQGLGPARVIETDGVEELQTWLRDHRTDFLSLIAAAQEPVRGRPAAQVKHDACRAIATALANVEDPLLQGEYSLKGASTLTLEPELMRGAISKAHKERTIQVALEHYQDELLHTTMGRTVCAHLEQRYGLRNHHIDQFGLGFAPEQWDGLKRAALRRGLTESALYEAGLVRMKERPEGPWHYDRFRGRIMLPLYSIEGRLLALRSAHMSGIQTSRRFGKVVEDTDSDVHTLFGLAQCSAAAGRHKEVWVVDDFRDVLALHAAGVTNVVSVVGGALTSEQAAALRLVAPRMVQITKAQDVESKPLLRTLAAALAAGLGADAVELPGGSCRQMLRKLGPEAIVETVKQHRRDFVQMVYEDQHARGLLTDAHQLNRVQEELATMTGRIADNTTRQWYEARAAAMDRVERIYDAVAFAAHFFRSQLNGKKEGTEAARYLKDRGLHAEIIEAFGLGFAPNRWDALLKAAQRHGISQEILEAAGLIRPGTDGRRPYDYFRGRVMFPIRDTRGEIRGFGGRILQPNERAPKYLNTPETPIFRKRQVLYGLPQSMRHARTAGEMILVEGYTDVLALHQAGIRHAVAACGTALTGGQVSVMRRYADRLLLLYDADPAGAKAAVSAIDLALEGGLVPFVVALPEGEDPDSYVVHHGAEALQDYLARHRRDFVTFLHEHSGAQGAFDTPEGRAEATHKVLDAIALAQDATLRRKAMKRASTLFNVPMEDIERVVGEKVPHDSDPREQVPDPEPPERDASRRMHDAKRKPASVRLHASEIALLELMVTGGREMTGFIMRQLNEEHFTKGPARRLVILLLEAYRRDMSGIALPPDDAELDRLVSKLKEDKPVPSEGWQKRKMGSVQYNMDREDAALGAIRRLKLLRLEEARMVLERRLRAAGPADQDRLLQELMELDRIRAGLGSLDHNSDSP